ncbi:MAG: SCO family protein [Bdellovibrionaceae bacterium]|nr:SCO family protein [Bdellovibrionales bacterium]MCB9083061.1 SCO family protein [Pseudobdellovibrionaceae bacterium]
MKKSVLLAICIWLGATLLWWAFAFAPTPGAAPAWLEAARSACFGRMPNGLPEPYGWMGLVLSPAILAIAILFVWSPQEVFATLKQALSLKVGQVFTAVTLILIGGESVWVAQKFSAALEIESVDFSAPTPDVQLPDNYPQVNKDLPAFSLVDQHGNTIGEKTFLGRPVVLTFAFAHCATVCPVIIHQVLQGLKEDDGAEFLVITLDPWRDTPGSLPTIAKEWELPSFAHVLSHKTIEEVTRLFPLFNMPTSRNDKTGDITHPALVFVINPQGQWVYTFNNPHPSWLSEAVRRVSLKHAGI